MIFHSAVTVPGQGNMHNMHGLKTLTVEIFGTSTARLVEFMTRGASGQNTRLTGVRLSDMTIATSTNATTPEVWQFDVAGLSLVLFPVVTVSGGDVSVIGTVAA